jgi:hypothetical protein
MSYAKQLEDWGACQEGAKWAGDRTLEEIWRECPRIDWLFWVTGKLEIDCKPIVLTACKCARLALPYVPDGEMRPLAAIEIAERWANGDSTITLEQVRAAAYAAADAANAAAYAAYAAADAAYAAAYAAYAANAAADAQTQQQCLAIFRETITLEMFLEADRKLREVTK